VGRSEEVARPAAHANCPHLQRCWLRKYGLAPALLALLLDPLNAAFLLGESSRGEGSRKVQWPLQNAPAGSATRRIGSQAQLAAGFSSFASVVRVDEPSPEPVHRALQQSRSFLKGLEPAETLFEGSCVKRLKLGCISTCFVLQIHATASIRRAVTISRRRIYGRQSSAGRWATPPPILP
jgi:hypothetical protein